MFKFKDKEALIEFIKNDWDNNITIKIEKRLTAYFMEVLEDE